ncbi:hypothetical protein F5Y06DRAFT_300028 [Hypoxylon sp. FL0890]|nr:hypothetical protein F5Y06DRAFT_300028 [Hypoxylon sp. FL0890]
MPIRNWIKAKRPPLVDHNKVPNHPQARGCVTPDNLFLCECGGIMKNKHHNISSHLTKVHKNDSAYQMGQFKGQKWGCAACNTTHDNFHAILAHYRRCPHLLRGSSAALRQEKDPYRPTSTLRKEFQRSL